MATVTSDKIDSKTKSFNRDEEGYVIMIESSIPHNKPKCSCKKHKPKLDKNIGRNKSITRVGDFITPLSITDRTIKQKNWYI